LETGALPVELRPYLRAPHDIGVQRRFLGGLFILLTGTFAAIGLLAAREGGRAWVVAAAAGALAVWMGELAYRMLR
jgi:hypothetical protein